MTKKLNLCKMVYQVGGTRFCKYFLHHINVSADNYSKCQNKIEYSFKNQTKSLELYLSKADIIEIK